jgi:hypothetical protein
MLESAEVGHMVGKAVFARQVPKVREALLTNQFEMLAHQRGPILMLVSGVESGGRRETANTSTNGWTRVICAPTRSASARRKNSGARWHGVRRALPSRAEESAFS